ncbi:hypothetical protein Fleli_3679 [Bernardetia litoralis DSM 6794]|uniref:Uncharacterized protein n=1 Tax=Bernardetia litoralis (strain ATCC 23117 / DSM 6794 / NBRC 15988 / NCIMB 1366 / Fx l1 / Sio-4) TaxID=880071 RepID=I4APV8_BERLS|nr:hypothetical protein [Bernardetia litoralis]AFM05993.1 hypothetical protein Fleli_3679 [Bernardetia litoralis DSM 6794]
MLPTKKIKNLSSKTDDGIIWKNNFWKRRTTIFYAGREIDHFQVKGLFVLRGTGILMDREFEIKTTHIWQNKFNFIDKTTNKVY